MTCRRAEQRDLQQRIWGLQMEEERLSKECPDTPLHTSARTRLASAEAHLVVLQTANFK